MNEVFLRFHIWSEQHPLGADHDNFSCRHRSVPDNVVLGAVGGLDIVWTVADNLNALMAAPNLIALLALVGVVSKEKSDYIKRMKDSNLL